MIETDIKNKRQDEWIRQHTLNPEQLKTLFENKLRRAAEMQLAFNRREVLVQKRR